MTQRRLATRGILLAVLLAAITGLGFQRATHSPESITTRFLDLAFSGRDDEAYELLDPIQREAGYTLDDFRNRTLMRPASGQHGPATARVNRDPRDDGLLARLGLGQTQSWNDEFGYRMTIHTTITFADGRREHQRVELVQRNGRWYPFVDRGLEIATDRWHQARRRLRSAVVSTDPGQLEAACLEIERFGLARFEPDCSHPTATPEPAPTIRLGDYPLPHREH